MIKDEEIVYMIQGDIDITDIKNFCDGACQKEFGRDALQWELTSIKPPMNEGLSRRVSKLYKKNKGMKYLVIHPQEV